MVFGATPLQPAPFENVLGALRAAGESTRLRIVSLCAEAELTVTELTDILGQSQPRVSRHLKVLCDAGVLVRAREGNSAFYRVAATGPGAEIARGLLSLLEGADPVLDRDRERLAVIRQARAEAATAYFRRNASDWDRIRSLYVDEAEVERHLLDRVPGRGAGDFLDVGTGTGRILEVIGPRASQGIGLDLSREMLAVARARLERADLPHCRVWHGDMYHLPWPEGSFDFVTIHQVLHYAERPDAVVTEAGRVLRPGGRLVVVDFAPHDLEFLREQHAHRRLGIPDEDMARWLADAGLRATDRVALPGGELTVRIWTADAKARRGAVRNGGGT